MKQDQILHYYHPCSDSGDPIRPMEVGEGDHPGPREAVLPDVGDGNV